MTTTYEIKTLRQVIDELRTLPAGAKVRGIASGVIHTDGDQDAD